MTKLIIARHGNTFSAGETPRRVGARTDLPLVPSGIEQARHLGMYLKQTGVCLDAVYAAPLLRTKQTAETAIQALGADVEITSLEIFTEIDYGPDENKTEEEVIARVGVDSIEAWNREARVPAGWQVDPQAIITNWQTFAEKLVGEHPTGTVLVVTSNGIARFSPYLTGDFDAFANQHAIKISTGALCVFEYSSSCWTINDWNVRPSKQLLSDSLAVNNLTK